jgi:ERCC4-type nuclease
MNIKVDVRESELIKKIQYLITNIPSFKEIKLITESLPLGDIIINDGTEDKIVIERKSINDLSASIKDGRYEEQSYRLNGLDMHNHNIIYLIEGNINQTNTFKFKERVDKLTIYSAIFSILYYKGFSILRTTDLDETATVLCNMVGKITRMKDKHAFYSSTNKLIQKTVENTLEENPENTKKIVISEEDKESDAKDYCKVVKKIKKENITNDNIGEIMLCQIPSISSQTALAILKKFKNIANLIKNIQDDESCLNDICTVDKNNKSRKISKLCIANILKFLK